MKKISVKRNRKGFIPVMMVIIITVFLTMSLISCEIPEGQGDSAGYADDIAGSTALETNERGETVVVATDKDGNKVVYETDKSGKIKESRKSEAKKKGEKQKEDEKTTAAATKGTTAASATAPATAATTKAQVCYISIDGYCSGKAVSVQGGDTAYSILVRSGASVSGSSSYVKGINGLYEFDKGPGSGWVYSVNGYSPSVGAGSYSVKAGDSISWNYITGN